MDINYDGYYDDVKPVDAGEQEEGVDPEMVKKVAILLAGVFAVILASVALMMLLESGRPVRVIEQKMIRMG